MDEPTQPRNKLGQFSKAKEDQTEATEDQTEATEELSKATESAEKQIGNFTDSIKNFTSSVRKSGLVGKTISKKSHSIAEKLKESKDSGVISKIEGRRQQAGLTSESMAQALFPDAPLLQSLAGGAADIGKSIGSKALSMGGSLLFGSGEDKEEDEAKLDGGDEAVEQTNDGIEAVNDTLIENNEDQEVNSEKEEEDKREDRDFWTNFFEGLFGKPDNKIEAEKGELSWAVIGAALLAGLAAWLTTEADFNNVFSGWSAGLNNLSKRLANSAANASKALSEAMEAIGKKISTFADDAAKSMSKATKRIGKIVTDLIKRITDFLPDSMKPKISPKPGAAADDLAEASVKSADDIAEATVKGSKFFKGASKIASRAALPLAIGVDTVMAGKDIYDANELENQGLITEDQLEDYAIERSAGAAGSIGGGLTGAAAGAALGTMMLPVIGTLLGGIVGGIGGAMLGEDGMTRLAESVTGGSGVDEVLQNVDAGLIPAGNKTPSLENASQLSELQGEQLIAAIKSINSPNGGSSTTFTDNSVTQSTAPTNYMSPSFNTQTDAELGQSPILGDL